MTTATEVSIGTLIERTPGVLGGSPCLAGTRFPILQVAVHHNAGETPEQMLDHYPHLDLARLYAGVAYYLANKAAVDAALAEEAAFYQAGLAEQKRLRALSQ